MSPYLIVGLGNPGSKYANTRHNLGFAVADALATLWRASNETTKFHSLVSEARVTDKKVLLLKPQTYMNRSGIAVSEIVTFYKIDALKELLIITDDLYTPEGSLRLRKSGSCGGHNGLQSIIDHLGTEGFPRLRIGIGLNQGVPSEDYVLSKISSKLTPLYKQVVDLARDTVDCFLREGIEKAMNKFNRKISNEATP